MKKALSIILILIGVFFVYFWYITEATNNLKSEIVSSLEQKIQPLETWENNYLSYAKFIENKSPNLNLEDFTVFLEESKNKSGELVNTNQFDPTFNTQGTKAREFEAKLKTLETENKQKVSNLNELITNINCQKEILKAYKLSIGEYQKLSEIEDFNSKSAENLLENSLKILNHLENLAQCEPKFDKKHTQELSDLIKLAKKDFDDANKYVAENGSNISPKKLQEVVQTYISKSNTINNAQTIFAKLHTFGLLESKILPEIRRELVTYKNSK